MMSFVPILVLALATALAAPPAVYDDFIETVPEKRAALVLDRLLVALRRALNEEERPLGYERPDRDGPRTAPLRIGEEESNEMSSLERRGQSTPVRGRVLQCYFNAVTCF